MFESRLVKLTVGRCESDRTLGLAVAQVPDHSATDHGGQIHPFGETLAMLFIGQDIGRQRQMTLDEDVDQTVLTQGADQTIESHGRDMADGRTPFQTEPAMSGQQGISGRLGAHRAVPQDEMGQHGKHGPLNLADFVVDGRWAVWVCVRLNDASYFHAIGSKTARRCTTPQPVLTRYKLLEIERAMFTARTFTKMITIEFAIMHYQCWSMRRGSVTLVRRRP